MLEYMSPVGSTSFLYEYMDNSRLPISGNFVTDIELFLIEK